MELGTLNIYRELLITSVISANEALNFIMVIIIQDGFQVDVEIGGYFTKMISHPAQKGPHRPQKRTLYAQKRTLLNGGIY